MRWRGGVFCQHLLALAFGSSQWPKAKGLVLFHEYSAGQEGEIQGAQAAWRYLLG
jgi:hypothetical protein